MCDQKKLILNGLGVLYIHDEVEFIPSLVVKHSLGIR